jgi:5-methylcytosine-specific restriction endonuclease McrA
VTREQRLSKKREYYRNNKHQWDAYYSTNKEKVKAKSRRWYYQNRTRLLNIQKAKRIANPQLERDNCKKWREANREKWLAGKKRWWKNRSPEQKAKKKEYYQKNKEEIKRKCAEYAKLHPEVVANTQAKRRALKNRSAVELKGIKEWMREVRSKPFARCHWCGTKVSGKKIQFDHIIALNLGGSHTIGNLCASCRDCNYSKHDRALAEWICRGQTFLPI